MKIKKNVTSKYTYMLSVILLFVCCFGNDDENSNPVTPSENAPSLPPLMPISIPINSPAQVTNWSNIVTNFISTKLNNLVLFQSIKPKYVDDKWIWNVALGEFNISATALLETENNVLWHVYLNGNDGVNVYTNWCAMNGNISEDGLIGQMVLFDTNTENIASKFNWEIDSAGNIAVGFDVLVQLINLSNKIDSSGELEVFQNDTLKIFDSAWQVNNGWWKEFDVDGNITNEGSW